jgi:hypothetical protein
VWRPLELYEPAPGPTPSSSSAPAPSAPRETTLPLAPLGTPDPEIARLTTEIVLGLRSPTEIYELIRRAGDDIPTLRLLSTLTEDYRPDIVRRLEAAGAHRVTPSLQRFERAEVIPGLTDGTELPDFRDGLTETQRRVVILMRELAPATRPPVSVGELVREVCSRDPKATPERVERALIDLSHPRLRAFPIVEARGVSVGLPMRLEAARLADWAESFFTGELALPLLLLNGAAGAGTAFPSFSHEEVLGGGALWPTMEPDVPTGGVLDGGSLGGLRSDGLAELRLRARVVTEFEEQSRRFRLAIDQLPWPLTIDEVSRRLRALANDGSLEGVRLVSHDANRVVMEFVHVAWARKAARNLMLRPGAADGPLNVTYVAKLAALGPSGPMVLSPANWLAAFFANRHEHAAVPVDRELETARRSLAEAEALAVALTLIDAVQGALRPAIDVNEERQALMAMMTPALSERLVPLGRLSHRFERGFTSAQATYLTSVKKLATRSREAAVAEFERRRDELHHLEKTRGQAVIERSQAVRDAVLIRFGSGPRRTQISR